MNIVLITAMMTMRALKMCLYVSTWIGPAIGVPDILLLHVQICVLYIVIKQANRKCKILIFDQQSDPLHIYINILKHLYSV